METFVFYLFGFLTISASWVVIYSKNLVYSAFALLFSFFGIAGLYGLLMADFLAATQVLIYVGGVLMLILFGVMLTARKSVMEITQSNLPRIPGAIIGGLMFLLLLYIIFSENSWNAASNQGDVTKMIIQITSVIFCEFIIRDPVDTFSRTRKYA